GEQDQRGAGDDLVGGQQRHTGKEPLGAAHGLPGDPGGGDDGVAGASERGTEDRADAAGADDADGQPGSGVGAVGVHRRSSPRGGTGRGQVPSGPAATRPGYA